MYRRNKTRIPIVQIPRRRVRHFVAGGSTLSFTGRYFETLISSPVGRIASYRRYFGGVAKSNIRALSSLGGAFSAKTGALFGGAQKR